MTRDDIGEGEVRGRHGDFLIGGIDVRCFEDVRGFQTPHERGEPFRGALVAGYEAFGAELGGSISSTAGQRKGKDARCRF